MSFVHLFCINYVLLLLDIRYTECLVDLELGIEPVWSQLCCVHMVALGTENCQGPKTGAEDSSYSTFSLITSTVF